MAFVNYYCRYYLKQAYPELNNEIDANFDRWRKLNIGCGGYKDAGWVNLDLLDNKSKEGDKLNKITVDGVNAGVHDGFVMHDFYKLDKFKPESFDVIFSQHVVEHIVHDRVDRTLKTWISLLKPGGYFYVCTPNFKFIVDDVYGEKKYFKTIDEAWVFIFNSGTHYSGHDPDDLTKRLLRLGLTSVKRLPRDEDKKEVKSELVLVGRK